VAIQHMRSFLNHKKRIRDSLLQHGRDKTVHTQFSHNVMLPHSPSVVWDVKISELPGQPTLIHHIDDIVLTRLYKQEVARTLEVLERHMCYRMWETNPAKVQEGWVCSSVVECLLSLLKALDSITNTTQHKNKKKNKQKPQKLHTHKTKQTPTH
jgi:hypothetical protein